MGELIMMRASSLSKVMALEATGYWLLSIVNRV